MASKYSSTSGNSGGTSSSNSKVDSKRRDYLRRFNNEKGMFDEYTSQLNSHSQNFSREETNEYYQLLSNYTDATEKHMKAIQDIDSSQINPDGNIVRQMTRSTPTSDEQIRAYNELNNWISRHLDQFGGNEGPRPYVYIPPGETYTDAYYD